MVATAPAVLPLMPFTEACELVVDYLKATIPLASWTLRRYDGEQQIMLSVRDDFYGQEPGDVHPWAGSLCEQMVTGIPPLIAPDAMAVPQYAATDVAAILTVGTYIGFPIRDGNGSLFGTLCGLDPEISSPGLHEHAPLLHMLTTLLGQILQAEALHAEALDREAEMHWGAFHDQLTGLPKRAMFLDRVGHALQLHRRDLRPLAVLLFDLDDFKAVNDLLGNAAADNLLVLVAERLRGAVRPADTLARLSGDEFALLLEDGTNPAAMAELILRAFAEPFTVAGSRVTASVSIGVTELSPSVDVPGVDAVIAQADAAMYASKRAGKARYTIYDPIMTLPGTRDLQLRAPLRLAIAAGAIEAAYQPIVELDSGRVVAFEALARWRHNGAMIAPDVFIPIAARGGLLSDLTDNILELACAQLARWSTPAEQAELQISVNVPPSLISDTGFPLRVAACIDRHHLRAEQLILEITEDALLTDPATAREVANQLYEVGATLSLDDFGTGYSSLLHLQQIPLHSVKIDRGFTHDLDTNPATERFMRAVLALGRDLGLQVVVEGVERATQADVLHRLGCRHAQGYLFGRPARPQEIDALTHPFGVRVAANKPAVPDAR